MIENQLTTVGQDWPAGYDVAGLTKTDRALFWGRPFLNMFAFDDLEHTVVKHEQLADGIRAANSSSY